jgi:regulatory protein
MTDCYTAALHILNHRFNSEVELRRKLARRKFTQVEIDETLTRLRSEKWLDDERFAGAFARTRALRRVGPARIRRELANAGVDREVASRAVAENSDDARIRADALALLAKKRRALVRRKGESYAESAEGKQKLMAYLLAQGYEMALVRELVWVDAAGD